MSSKIDLPRLRSNNKSARIKNDRAVPDLALPAKFGRTVEFSSANGFPARMPLGEFLFEYLYRNGVRHSFGIPGDFALPTFTWLEKSKIQNVTMTHEPAAGFAADAYSRIKGLDWFVSRIASADSMC